MQNAIVMSVLTFMLAHGQTADARLVPLSLLDAATADPFTFVRLLLESGTPAGLELRDGDRLRIPTSDSQRWHGVDRLQLQRESRVQLAEVITRFNARQPAYLATDTAGVVVIRPRASPHAGYLDTFATFGQIGALNAMDLARQVFAPLATVIDSSGGRPGSQLGNPDTVQVQSRPMTVNGDGNTIISVLNDIASMSGDQAWLVITSDDDPGRILRFGILSRDGSASLSSAR